FLGERDGQLARNRLDRWEDEHWVEVVLEVSHRYQRTVKASEDHHGSVHCGASVRSNIAQILDVAEHVAGCDLIGIMIWQLDLDPLMKLLESLLISCQR